MILSAVKELIGRDCSLDLSKPAIMGVLNATPDSFYDGGRYNVTQVAVERGLEMALDGAAILDIGGESTRPGAAAVSIEEELNRVIPVIEGLRRKTDLPISIDTSKGQVAREAMAAGANFINDISGLSFDPNMAAVAAESGAGLFLMHTSGRPEIMQQQTNYQDLVAEVIASLSHSIELAVSAGIAYNRLAVDPGIGFGKTVVGNLEILRYLEQFHQLGCPVLLGTSRKSFIGTITGCDNPNDRLAGSLATIALGVNNGVQLFRVHDVAPARKAAMVAWAIREQQIP